MGEHLHGEEPTWRKGKIQLTYVIVAPPEQVAEGDRIFQSHAPWMEATHHRSGDKALLTYHLSKAPELSNPFDPSSAPTGNGEPFYRSDQIIGWACEDSLTDELRARGADILDGPEARVYGQRELVVRDCSDFVLAFGEATPTGAP